MSTSRARDSIRVAWRCHRGGIRPGSIRDPFGIRDCPKPHRTGRVAGRSGDQTNMGFLDLFKPRWKHSDPDVRAEAVRQLDENDARILAQVARRETDVRVRRIALKKIADPALL